MALSLKFSYCLLCVVVLLPALAYSQNYIKSRASYYGTSDGLGTTSGACGFGEYGRKVNDGNAAAVSRALWKEGAGCGACYQVKCKKPECNAKGVNIVVTDHGEGDRTDFIMSSNAFKGMARPYMEAKLVAYGVVDVEYQRIACQYTNYNLIFRVHENSRFPNYLAIVVLYKSGIYDVVAVDIWQEEHKQWLSMRRAWGAVFDMPNPPKGPITLRFKLSGSSGFTYKKATNALPSKWKVGTTIYLKN